LCLVWFLLLPVSNLKAVSPVKAGQIFSGPVPDVGPHVVSPVKKGKAPFSMYRPLSLHVDDFGHKSDGDRLFPPPLALFSRGCDAPISDQNRTQSTGAGLNMGTLHKYCGLGTILSAGTAALSGSDHSVHHISAYTAAGLALVTCLTGFFEYRDIFQLDAGLFSKYNLHIILGTLGTVGCVTAVALADSGEDSGHGGFGSGGAACMLVGFTIIKW